MSIVGSFKTGMEHGMKDARIKRIVQDIICGNFTAEEIAKRYNIEVTAVKVLMKEAEKMRGGKTRNSGSERE